MAAFFDTHKQIAGRASATKKRKKDKHDPAPHDTVEVPVVKTTRS
jgi:hypothetical protein